MITTKTNFSVDAQTTASPAVNCWTSSITLNVSNTLSKSTPTFTITDDPSYDSKTIVLTGIVQFGQTLIIDGLQRLGMECSNVVSDQLLLLCPGSTVIVKNSQLQSVTIASTGGTRDTCSTQCGFPPGIDETNIPLDSNGDFMVNISIFNNILNSQTDGITFRTAESKDCVIFNNTRYQIEIYNNTIEILIGYGLAIGLRNMVGIKNASDVYLSFLRNLLVRNNNFQRSGCLNPLTWTKGFLRTDPENYGSTASMNPILVVGAEGSVNVDQNKVRQECTDHIILAQSRPPIALTLTTFGVHPSFLPLRINISNNNMQGAQTWVFIFVVVHSARVDYPNGYTFTRSNTNFVQTKNPSRRKDFFEILPSRDLAPIVIVENNVLRSEFAIVNRFIHVEYVVDSRSPEIRGFIESMYSSSSSSLQQALNSNSTLFNLYWYPEREIFGSIQIRNNNMTAFLPVKPLSYWISGVAPNANFSGTMFFIYLDNLYSAAKPAVLANVKLPPSSQSRANNYSSLMFSLEKVIVENNSMNASGIHFPTGVHFDNLFRAQTVRIRNCTFEFFLTQSGNRKSSGDSGQTFRGIDLDFPATIEALEVSGSSFHVEKLTYAANSKKEAGTYFESTGVFGLVSFKFNNNKFFGRFASMESWNKIYNFYANSYTSAFDFSALLNSKFIPSYEFRNLSFDLSQSSFQVFSSGQNALKMATLMLPTGSIIFDNIFLAGRSQSPSSAITLERNVVVESDSLIISNVNLLFEGVSDSRAVLVDGPYLFIRKELIITNISTVLRPFIFGAYIVNQANMPDGWPCASTYLVCNCYDPTSATTSNSISASSPFPKSMYKNPPVQSNGAIADKSIYLEISNILLKVDHGVAIRQSATYFSARGLNCRSSSSSSSNNNYNDKSNEISVLIKNITLYAGYPAGDLRSISNSGARLAIAGTPVDSAVASIGVWPTPNWNLTIDSYFDTWGAVHDPRQHQIFPDSSSLASSTPQTITIEDAVQLVDYRARAVGVNVVEMRYTDVGFATETIPGVTSSNVTFLPPKIITRNIRSETAIIPSVFPPGITWASANAAFNPNEVISVKRSSTDFQVPTLDGNNFVSVSSTTDSSSVITSTFVAFRSGVAVASLTLENIFAPLFRQLWDISYATVGGMIFSGSATSGLQKLIISPPSSSFTEINYEKFLKNHRSSSNNNKINNDYLKNIGTCGVFFGNRPISNEDRVISTMAGSALSPFNKKPISVHSKNYFDQIQFTPCLTETKSKSMSKTRSRHVEEAGKTRSSETISQSSTKHFDPKSSPFSASSSLATTSSVVTLALTAFATASSTAALAIRTRTILSGVEEIMNNDCGSPFTEEFFDTPPLISASPTQMYISGGRNGGYATGLIVGDFILILALVGTWFLFFVLIEKYVIPFLQSRKRSSRAKRIFTKNIFTLRFLAESKIMIPAFNFGLMFLDPMFNSSIALIFIKEVGFGWKILAVVISILFLLVGFFFFSVIYKILISRNQIEKWHKFRPNELKTSKNPVLKLWYLCMDAEGEWMCPKEGKRILKNNNETKSKNNKKVEIMKITSNDVISWRFAEPVIDGFTNRFPRFAIVDILVMLCLAIALVIGHATANCTVMGILLLFPVTVHLLLVIFYRPDQEFLLRVLIPVTDLLQVILVGLALGGVDEGVVTALAGILVAIQMLLTVLWVIAIALSIVGVMKEFQICEGNRIRQKEHRQSSNLRELMPSKNNRQYDRNPHRTSSENRRDESRNYSSHNRRRDDRELLPVSSTSSQRNRSTSNNSSPRSHQNERRHQSQIVSLTDRNRTETRVSSRSRNERGNRK